ESLEWYNCLRAAEDGLLGYSLKWGLPLEKMLEKDFKPASQKLRSFNWRITAIVDELVRIDISLNESYKRTAKLLSIAFPHLYKDTDHNLIRQRYAYHKQAKPK
ncbi:MAG: hypothetical protein OEW04_11520, partial [Nitrospirota bacterium]|nr:hypothetical protein [Nitrospirota bacterium]